MRFFYFNTDNGPDEGGHPEALKGLWNVRGVLLKCSVLSPTHDRRPWQQWYVWGPWLERGCQTVRSCSGLWAFRQRVTELAVLSAHCLNVPSRLEKYLPLHGKEPGAQRVLLRGMVGMWQIWGSLQKRSSLQSPTPQPINYPACA